MKFGIKSVAFFAVLAGLIGAAIYVAVLRPSGPQVFDTPGFGQMTAQELSGDSYKIVPEMLSTIYRAFEETDETVIYDKLAQVSARDALETLYLERAGAMMGGGLADADQTLHAMELISLSSEPSGTTISMNVKWHVLGTVGHAEHLHVRGNTYAANLTVEPVDGAWRMTRFDLTDVDRADAGTMVGTE